MDADVSVPPRRREQAVVLAALFAICALAWIYLWWDASTMRGAMAPGMPDMPGMPGMRGMPPAPWAPAALLLSLLMWVVMMAGMMLPSAAPAILLYGKVARNRAAHASAAPATLIFAAGYLAAWSVFSVAATGLQAALQSARLLTPMLDAASPLLAALVLVLAGVYQWLPAKDACLEQCRAPLSLFLFRWRPGIRGAFRMGFGHGLFCVGCCWALMLVLFAVGVMNLLWVALLAALVLLEKQLPGGRRVARLAGAVMVGLGVRGLLQLP